MNTYRPKVLNDLRDVNAASPTDNDSLTWDNATSRWVPESRLSSVTFSKTGVWSDPTAADDVEIWRAPFACTVSKIYGYKNGGTSFDLNVGKNGTGTELISSDYQVTSDTTWSDAGADQNLSLAAGDYLVLRLKALVGAPTVVIIQVDLTRP